MLQGGVNIQAAPPSALTPTAGFSSLAVPGQADTIAKLLNGAGLPPAVMPTAQPPQATIGPLKPEQVYSPVQRLGNAVGGAATGILKGVFPDERIHAPNAGYDPLVNQAEVLTRVPTSIIANVIGASATNGTYNAAAGGLSMHTRNREAQDSALKAGQWAVAKRIRDANAVATLSNAAYEGALAHLPGSVGNGVGAHVATGAAMGYGQDLATQAMDQYALTGKVDASKLNYTPGLGAVMGAAIPGVIHYAPQIAKSLPNATQAIQLSLTHTADKVGSFLEKAGEFEKSFRKAEGGFIRIGGKSPEQSPSGTPMQGDYKRGVTERQFAGEKTGEIVPMISTGAMQQEANEEVKKAIDAGHPESVLSWIQVLEENGKKLEANAVRLAAIADENLPHFSPEDQAQLMNEAKDIASEHGRGLQQYQNNPLLKARAEFLDAAIQDFDKGKPVEGVEDAIQEVTNLVEDSFTELFNILINAFKFTIGHTEVEGKRFKRTGGSKRGKAPQEPKVSTPKKVKVKEDDSTKRLLARALEEDPTQPLKVKARKTTARSVEEQETRKFAKERLRAKAYIRRRLQGKKPASTKKPYKFTAAERELLEKLDAKQKADKKNLLKLKTKIVKQPTQAEAMEAQRKALLNAYDKEWNQRRKEALRALVKLEQQLNVQQKLKLGLKNEAKTAIQDLSADALATLSPEELAYLNDMVRRQTRSMLFAKLEKRLKAGESVAVRNKGKSLDELYDALEPIMTAQEKQAYKQRKTAIERRRYLQGLARTTAPRTKKTLLDRLVEAHGHELLNASHPQVLDSIMHKVKGTIKISPEDYAQLQAYITACTDPTLTTQAKRRAHALLQRFIYDHQAQHLYAKFLSFRTTGLLLREITQVRNYIDMGLGWAKYRTYGAALRELGEFAYSKMYASQYGGKGERGLVIKISNEVKDFYQKHEITLVQELQNILFDTEHGTNTARNHSGDILDAGSLPPSLLHNKGKGKFKEVIKEIDKRGSGVTRAILSSGDRLAFADVYRHALTKEIETYKRAHGALPDVNSEAYGRMRRIALDTAEQITYTNKGGTSHMLGAIKGGLTKVVDGYTGAEHPASSNAGSAVVPFTTIIGNIWLRPLENIPGVGMIAIGVPGSANTKNGLLKLAQGNRFGTKNWGSEADKALAKSPEYNRVVAGQLVAAQTVGLAMTATAGMPMMYYAGYHGAFNIPPRDKSLAASQVREDSGRRRGSVNLTAFQRYMRTQNPEDFITQEGDETLYTFGLNEFAMPLLYMTATGREDKAKGLPASPRYNPVHYPGMTIKGVSSQFLQNDALSGLARITTEAKEARDPETNEHTAEASVHALASDVVGFKLPGSDIIPQPVRAPRNYPEQYLSKLPFLDQMVPKALDSEGKVKMQKGLLGHVEADSNFASYMHSLHEATGSSSHLMGPMSRTVDTFNDAGSFEKTTLTLEQRHQMEATVKPAYAAYVSEIKDSENFKQLPDKQKIEVLSKIKNDILKAYMAKYFRVPLVRPSYTVSGGKNYHKDDAQGARALRAGNTQKYNRILNEYIKKAHTSQKNDTGTERLQKRVGNNPKRYGLE